MRKTKNISHPTPVTKHRSPDIGHPTQVTRHRSPNIGHPTSVTGHQSSIPQHPSPNIRHRSIALFFLFTFLNTLIPYNQLWANNNGPNAPEAAAFEPVDATDMVNLLTGDFSYVLPLLNVPSPEGGYPLALSYHGGIAHNQEASWVGLGWNLNPGSINRNVNGFPDDWGKTQYDEFFYDAGWTEDEYNFSVGVDTGGFNVGIGASWGSHRSTGGFVSMGVGSKGFGMNATIGTDGASIGAGYKGFNASVGTNGVGINYGGNFKGSELGYGLSLNYSHSSGLSGGFSLSGSNTTKSNLGGKTTYHTKSSSIGVNFSSNGPSLSGRINGKGGGLSIVNYGVTNGDYNIEVDGFQVGIPIYMFYIGFGHKRVTYSLYKRNNLSVSGSVYPYHQNEVINQTGDLSYEVKENYFMDVTEFPAFSNQSMSLDHLVESGYKEDKNNFTLPAYDSYTVTSQGLSGAIAPSSYQEMNLIDRGKGEQNGDNSHIRYLNTKEINKNFDLGNNTHFYFENSFSSFLRIDRSDFGKSIASNTLSSDKVFNGFETSKTNMFDEVETPNGISLKTNDGKKRRDGSVIETFTNKQIRENNLFGFLEAKNINRNTEKDTFLDEGIGAFRITALDGKTYHYSLPVYNFELFYKNFKDEDNENKNFFEVAKTKPYATHWLLTAVTGPDYIDKNNNGELDNEDFGYWVEFDYGKWTDGYVWRGPFDGYEEHENIKDPNNKTYSYYWGRKQVYYLDAVKTRTHTALFVKKLRDDNVSKRLRDYKKKYDNGVFDTNVYSESFNSKEKHNKDKIVFGKPGDQVFKTNGENLKLPTSLWFGETIEFLEYAGNKTTKKYVDIPSNRTLKLDKIVLVANKESFEIDKSRGDITETLTGYQNFNIGYSNVVGKAKNGGFSPWIPIKESDFADVLMKPTILQTMKINRHDKVLDERDIFGTDLLNKAQQVIEFGYDYSLAKGSPNSYAAQDGRLTLRSVDFKGKRGVSYVPPYKFDYEMPEVVFDKENQDVWGYHKDHPEAWSLNEITTPTGGKIKIENEADSFYSEAAYTPTKSFSNLTITKLKDSNLTEVNFNDSRLNLNEYFSEGIVTNFNISRYDSFDAWHTHTYTDKKFKVNIKQIDNNAKKIIIEKVANEIFPFLTNEEFIDLEIGLRSNSTKLPLNHQELEIPYHYYYEGSIKSTKGPILDYAINKNNGLEGGGVRVASIEVEGNGTVLRTEYDYTNFGDNKISGITSYAPSKEQKGIPYVSELPAPLVTYGNVTMKNYDTNDNFLGSTAYEFDVLKPYQEHSDYLFCLGDFFKVKEQQNETFIEGKVKAKKYTIYNKLNDIGRVLSVASYNSLGQLLNNTVTNYKPDLDNDGQIGVRQESYKSFKKLKNGDEIDYLITSSSKVDYPSVVESTTNTSGGVINTVYNSNFDFLTGRALETHTVSSSGKEFKTKVVPAYHIPEYADNSNGYSMGAKADNLTNKNMLTQTAATIIQFKDIDGNWKTVGASATTWNNNWGYQNYDGTTETPADASEKIWRKHKGFIWKGEVDSDGAYVGYEGDLDDFNWNNPEAQTNSEWTKTSTINLYDHYSMPLETEDINGNKASTKTGDHQSKVFAVGNAGYNEMFFSGAEDLITGTQYFGGEVYKGTNAKLVNTFHTGSKAIESNKNVTAFATKPDAGNYKISVWAYNKTGFNYTGTKVRVGANTPISYNPDEIIEAGDWVFLNFYTNGNISGGQVVKVYNDANTAIYDDFRIHPIESSMTSYIYNQWDELSYIIGSNGLATHYVYDAGGRLIETYVEAVNDSGVTGGFKQSSFINYKYKNQ